MKKIWQDDHNIVYTWNFKRKLATQRLQLHVKATILLWFQACEISPTRDISPVWNQEAAVISYFLKSMSLLPYIHDFKCLWKQLFEVSVWRKWYG